MPSASKIPQNINKYAIKCSYEIRNKKVEFGKSIDFVNNSITNKSKLVRGTNKHINFNFSTNAKDVFVHNHPDLPNSANILSLGDIGTAILNDIKKIYASTSKGYTAMDFTTVKKSVSKDQMYRWILGQKTFWEIEELLPPALAEKKKLYYETIKEFAKFSGATFSDVKWTDFSQLKENKQKINPLTHFVSWLSSLPSKIRP